jgi:thioredoxin reductase/CRP-like cAMP-binding protein/Fe-S-cluster-containing hydrogenase component 2
MSDPIESMSERYQIVIVGGGPAGLAAGIQAARRGVSHVVLERGEFANTIHRYQKGKHVMDEPQRLHVQPELSMEFRAGTRESILEHWRKDVEAAGVQLRRGTQHEVVAITGAKPEFRVALRGGTTLIAEHVVLAIGNQGNLRRFGVEGEDLPHVTYQLDDPAEHKGKRVIVVGVGDAGIENALALVEHDNDVSVVNRREEFDRAKTRNRMLIEASINAGEITHLTNSGVKRFEPGAIVLSTDQGESKLGADLVIGRLGALPPRKFLQEIGIAFPSEAKEAVPVVSERFESNVPGIFLVGSLAGRPLIKSCMNEGFEAVEYILGQTPTPADEPMLREILGPLKGTVAEIIERIRSKIPLFESLTPIQLREFLVDSKVHLMKSGDVVFRQNDFTDTFYSILDGEVEVLLSQDDSRTNPHLGRGEFFGEISLLSGRRRSATVRCAKDSVLIETSRMAMQKLRKSFPQVSRVLDTTTIMYRLADLAPTLSHEERRTLAAASVIASFEAGATLCNEGDDPDGLHLIRRGTVVISRKREGRDVVINYVQAGNYIGEVALIYPGRKRGATVRAMVQTETIRVPTEAILQATKAHPELRENFERRSQEQVLQAEQALANPAATGLVDFLIGEGGKDATDLLVIDESLCIRCDNCEKACADTHQGVSRLDREGGARYAQIHLPTACQHCENPKCMLDCPPDAIRRHPNAEVYILDTCIGCGNCATNCPYDVIQMAVLDDEKPHSLLLQLLFGIAGKKPRPKAAESGEGRHEVAVKCDLCRDLPARRHGEARAACVASCPTGAIARVKPQDFIHTIMEDATWRSPLR